MDTQPAFGFKELLTCVIADMAKAISERNGESKQQQFTRSQAAAAMILGFRPRDVIEAMLAGHCVMFHEVIVDSVHDTLRGELDTLRRGTRSNLVAMNKSFAGNLALLERYQMRPSEGSRDAAEGLAAEARTNTPEASQAPVAAAAEPASSAAAPISVAMPGPAVAVETSRVAPIATRSATPQSANFQTPTPGLQPVPAQTASARTAQAAAAPSGPSAMALAAFHANPEAAAALEAGDPFRFARAMGIEPSEEFLAAAAEPGSPFDRHAAGPWVMEPASGGSKV
jgi:hypothetical protein